MMPSRDPLYACYRYPAEIIGHAVRLYFSCPLGIRMVKQMLATRPLEGRGEGPDREEADRRQSLYKDPSRQ
jgi:hypothetical protein